MFFNRSFGGVVKVGKQFAMAYSIKMVHFEHQIALGTLLKSWTQRNHKRVEKLDSFELEIFNFNLKIMDEGYLCISDLKGCVQYDHLAQVLL